MDSGNSKLKKPFLLFLPMRSNLMKRGKIQHEEKGEEEKRRLMCCTARTRRADVHGSTPAWKQVMGYRKAPSPVPVASRLYLPSDPPGVPHARDKGTASTLHLNPARRYWYATRTHTPERQTDTMRQCSFTSTLAHLVRKSWNDLFISSQLKLQEQEHFNGNINIKWS